MDCLALHPPIKLYQKLELAVSILDNHSGNRRPVNPAIAGFFISWTVYPFRLPPTVQRVMLSWGKDQRSWCRCCVQSGLAESNVFCRKKYLSHRAGSRGGRAGQSLLRANFQEVLNCCAAWLLFFYLFFSAFCSWLINSWGKRVELDHSGGIPCKIGPILPRK